MAKIVQRRRGTTAEHSTFTGAVGELTVDTTKDTVVVHDGAAAGGYPLAKENLSNVPSGTITSTMIADGTIVNADVNASAAIAGTKISPDFGSQNAVTTGTNTAASFIPTSSSIPTNGVYLPAANTVAVATNGVERIKFGTAEAVVNDGGADYDFRIEGDTNANLVFVDASTDRVGIGTSAPGVNLHVNSAGNTVVEVSSTFADSTTTGFRVNTTGDASIGRYDFQKAGTTRGRISYVHNATGASELLGFNVAGGSDKLVINGAGRVGIATTTPNEALEVAGNIHLSGADRSIFNRSNNALTFGTNNAERARIDSSGRLLVGTSTSLDSDALLQVYKASGNIYSRCQSGSLSNTNAVVFEAVASSRNSTIGVYKHSGITNNCGFLRLSEEDGQDQYFWADNSAQFRISTNIAHVGTTSGTVVGTQTSDERIKNILGPVAYGLAEIKQLDPVSYALKSDPEQVPHLGFIAQQVNPIIPESVFDTDEVIEEGEPTKLGMEYVALIPVLVNAIKELSAEVDALKAQLQAL